jgi:hypothetical protein
LEIALRRCGVRYKAWRCRCALNKHRLLSSAPQALPHLQTVFPTQLQGAVILTLFSFHLLLYWPDSYIFNSSGSEEGAQEGSDGEPQANEVSNECC